jgi:uncharacterized protein involved in type VI secretion and phage assembly
MPGEQPTSGVTVKLDGAELDLSTLLEVQVRDDVHLPDTAVVRLRDPKADKVGTAFTIGQRLEVAFAGVDATATTVVFRGEIVALEPEFTEAHCIVAARAYDFGWRLNRHRASRTFQDRKAEDMVATVAQANGLSRGTVESTTVTHKFFQQSMETDWEFCWRLARMLDYEFTVDEDRRFHFRPRTKASPVVTLTWGERGDLLSFRPRMSGAGQVARVTVAGHDPGSAQQMSGNATQAALPAQSDAVASRQRVASALGAGSVVVADRVVTTQPEANDAAQAALDRLASSFVEAEGKAKGDPRLRAGKTIKLAEVAQFSGDYVLARTVHTYRSGGAGYTTSFVISGRTPHTISDLVQRNGQDWASSLVIGIVTNNNDPDKLGRVRVKFPALGASIEGWWARVATIGAGNQRGVYMLPQPDDEVVVAFEHGDTRRPVVLGTLFNGGRAKPPADLTDAQARKPRFGLKTTHDLHIAGTQAMLLRTGEKLTVEVNKDGQGGTGNYLLDAKGNIEQKAAMAVKASGQTIELTANQSVTIKGSGQVTIESTGPLKLKGTTVDVEGSAMVNVKGPVINLG